MSDGERLAKAAASFIGAPFRLHGRCPDTGLDCVGLVELSLAQCGRTPNAPRGYRLRNASIQQWIGLARKNGLEPVIGPVLVGDVLLTSPGPGQNHLLIADSRSSAIHAHAGLRRVVRQPLPAPSLLRAHWRLAVKPEEI